MFASCSMQFRCTAGTVRFRKWKTPDEQFSRAGRGMRGHRNHFLLGSHETALECDHVISFIKSRNHSPVRAVPSLISDQDLRTRTCHTGVPARTWAKLTQTETGKKKKLHVTCRPYRTGPHFDLRLPRSGWRDSRGEPAGTPQARLAALGGSA